MVCSFVLWLCGMNIYWFILSDTRLIFDVRNNAWWSYSLLCLSYTHIDLGTQARLSMAIDRRSQFTLQMMVKATQIYTTLFHVMETGRTTDINMEGSAFCSDDSLWFEKTWLNLMLLHDEPGTEAVWPWPGGGVDCSGRLAFCSLLLG